MRSLRLDDTIGKRYSLCGPKVYALRELVRYAGAITDNERPILALGKGLGRLQASIFEHLPGTLLSRDNLTSMEKDSVCDCEFSPVFGVVPTGLEAIAPSYLSPDAIRSRYDGYRAQGGR